jgi:hypothetical protein
MNEHARTSSGHRKRINIHSCFFSGGPVPLLRLGCGVRVIERFSNNSNGPLDLDIDGSKVRHRRYLAYSRRPSRRYYRAAWDRRARRSIIDNRSIVGHKSLFEGFHMPVTSRCGCSAHMLGRNVLFVHTRELVILFAEVIGSGRKGMSPLRVGMGHRTGWVTRVTMSRIRIVHVSRLKRPARPRQVTHVTAYNDPCDIFLY